MTKFKVIILSYNVMTISLIVFFVIDQEVLVITTKYFVNILFELLDLPIAYLPKAYGLLMNYIDLLPSGFVALKAILTLCIIQTLVFLFAIRWYGYVVLVLALVLFPILNLFIEPVLFRRVLFTITFLPTVPRMINDGKRFIDGLELRNQITKLLYVQLYLSVLIYVTPGFYLPPFFDGIAGWSVSVESDGYELNTLRIRYHDGSTSWFKASFFNPLTMRGRPEMVIQTRDDDFYERDFGCMLLALYEKAYPSLERGFLPTQSILGSFAYGTHSVDAFLESDTYLSPEFVDSMEYVRIKTVGDLRTEKISNYWSVDNCDFAN